MDTLKNKLGIKLELELINSLGEKIGQSYISQLMDIVDEQNIIIAAPILESRLMLITPGTRVRGLFLDDKYGLLSFTGVITGKEKTESIISLKVKIESDFEKIQRRKYFRLDCVLNAAYRVRTDADSANPNVIISDKDFKKTLTKNLSGSGTCLVAEDEISKNSVVDVILWLNDTLSIKAVCKVMRVLKIEGIRDKKYELGLYFSDLTQRDQDAVVKYIFEQQRLLLKKNLAKKD